ncbi:head-to-tail adaptor [Microbacterium phage Zooman]|nr:head-to-tail adaptor [Microbacterium phage Zooman]
MTNLEALWVLPSDIDESLDLEIIDPADVDTLKDYEYALAACEFSSQILWTLSGRKFHMGKVVTEQYVPNGTAGRYLPANGLPYYDRDAGFHIVDSGSWNSRKIKLDGTPVRAIGSVTDLATGEALDPSEYSIINRAYLYLEKSNARGIDVSYTYGSPPPITGRMAAKEMARQFFFSWSGREGECNLPDRVTAVTRQGVSWVLLDNQDFLDELKTGIYMVDMFLRSVNPDKARVKAKVFSVDIPRGRRRSL